MQKVSEGRNDLPSEDLRLALENLFLFVCDASQTPRDYVLELGLLVALGQRSQVTPAGVWLDAHGSVRDAFLAYGEGGQVTSTWLVKSVHTATSSCCDSPLRKC